MRIKLSQVCDILFCFDTKSFEWETPKVSGNLPGARDGHSACIVGSRMFIVNINFPIRSE